MDFLDRQIPPHEVHPADIKGTSIFKKSSRILKKRY
jgi:hypothetical protein